MTSDVKERSPQSVFGIIFFHLGIAIIHDSPEKAPTWWKIFVWICLYCFNCTKFSLLILRKIIKIVATRCHNSRLKCTKFDFGWGSAPDPAGEAYSAPPDLLAALRGPTSKGGVRGEEGEGSVYVDTPVSARVRQGKHLP